MERSGFLKGLMFCAWLGVAVVALLLSYFGQKAWLPGEEV